jgi:hypothetical protein
VAVKPTFATNRPATDGRPEARVADAINGLLAHRLELWNTPFELAIATGYFNPAGFALLADALERVGEVRLLLGAEPERPEWRVRPLDPDTPPERAERARLRDALAGHVRAVETDRDLLGFAVAADAATKRLIEWLRSGRVQVRRLEQRFLHGKAFVIATHADGVLAGSSNFTYAGLAKNAELNLGNYDPRVVGDVMDWFEEQWADAVPFDLAAIYDERFVPHNPYIIYLRMLYERYGEELRQEAEEAKLQRIHLTSFQKDGVWRARRILREYGGVVIADGVGLGKSYLGGELMREAVQERRQRVLLVAPATLRDGPWRTFLEEHQLGVKVVSFEELANDRQLNPDGTGRVLSFDFNEYAMVLIDEAHAYRNPDTLRAAVLRRLLSGSPPKDLVLMTATPVNNSLWDLYYLLTYFVKNDATFADLGIGSLREHFAEAVAASADELSPERLFDVLDAISVRRTRHFVKRYYPHDTVRIGGLEIPITFPEPKVRKVTYDLDAALPGVFAEFAHALAYDDAPEAVEEKEADLHARPRLEGVQLTLARYVPSRYLRGGSTETHEVQLAGLLRSGLLKRFESSAHAFARSCRTMARSHDAFLYWLERGYVVGGEALTEWLATDRDFDEGAFGETETGELPAGAVPATPYRIDALKANVAADRDLLVHFAELAERVTYETDAKLHTLVAELRKIVREAASEGAGEEDERDRRKVLLFSYFADTVEWVRGYLESVFEVDPELSVYSGRLASVTGSTGDRTDVLFGFAPNSTKAPPGADRDRYDVLVASDTLAEGVSLQQARHVVNYDLPWNPMRLVQRHGRVDRIGSKHDKVFLRCFFPDAQLDALLGLEARLHTKLAQAAASIGVESEVLPGAAVSEHSFAETRAEIERLRSENPELFETGGETGTAYSGEEYRQELREGIEHADLEQQLKRLPWGSGSGKAVAGGPPGFVFCARVGDHPTALFRYVAYPDGGVPVVDADTLTCFARAHATPDTLRVLPEATRRRAYDAWDAARRDIFERWDAATDFRTLQPVVPKALRDAAELLRDHPPPGVPTEEVHRAIDALEAPYPVRIQKMVRDAMRGHESVAERTDAVLRVVAELGLEPPEPPEPLPVITEEDVHLICWLALVPEGGDTRVNPVEYGAPQQTTFAPDTQRHLGE